MKINYIIRNDGVGLQYSNALKNFNISDLLKEKYDYLYRACIEDKYNIRLESCNLFKELIYKNRVVGFVTYRIFNENQYLLTNIFILSGYRRNYLFYDELEYQFMNNNKITIFEPNRQVIEALIKYNWAKKITDNLLVSAINFEMKQSKLLSITNQKLVNGYALSNIYDTDICSTLSFKIFNKSRYNVYYSAFQEDDKRFNCIEKREKISKQYFDKLVSEIIDRDSEIERWLFLLRKNLPSKKISSEEIIGKPTKFSQKLLDFIDEGLITNKEAKFIQNQLFLELKTGKVELEALELRLNYLTENYHEKVLKNNDTDNYCPYCFEDVDYIENYCMNCGYTLYHLNELNEEEFVYKHLLEEKRSYKYSLTGKKELKKSSDDEYNITSAMCMIIDNLENGKYGEELFTVISHQNNLSNINLEEYMVNKGYINYSMDWKKWDIESKYLKNVELKAILKDHNCKVSGNKIDLIQRIKQEVPLEDLTSFIPSVTKKGYDFLEDSDIFLFHYTVLKDYVFEEFKEYCDNEREEMYDNLALSFLDKHIEVAHQTRNHDQLVDSLRNQAKIHYNLENYMEVLKLEFEIFLINLNMMYIDSHYYPYYNPIDDVTYDVFDEFPRRFSNEYVNEVYIKTYDSFDKKYLKISSSETRTYLRELFLHFSLTVLNMKIKEKYYNKLDYKTLFSNRRKRV